MVKLEELVSLAKRRGFIWPSSEIYGGLSGVWDYGPMGIQLKRNIQALWWRMFVEDREDMFGVDAGIMMSQRVWEASGHVSGFSDPLVECEKCHKRFRADHIKGEVCPDCDGKLSESREFNMMFETHIGASRDTASTVYLRPETAQGMFVNFKNLMDSMHPKLPFGMGQIGKAFRNEINARDFIFRVREFEQMEIEYFTREEEWEEHFGKWRNLMHEWMKLIGLPAEHIHELEVEGDDLAHYSKRTIDFEFDFPFGREELYGLAYRTDFDLKAHMESSGVDLRYFDDQKNERFLPHVIEPTFGLERTVLAVLAASYTTDEMGEGRVFLKLPKRIAPVAVAVFPLVRNKPEITEKALAVYQGVKRDFPTAAWDDSGNIGKRYRRQDEIGTPYCVTIDHQTLEDDTVTLRDRDTGKQERIGVGELLSKLSD